MVLNLDLKDRKILHELDINCRQSDSQIAKKVRLSRDLVRYRIKRLEEEGYINYYMTILNSMKLGFDWYRTFFKFHNLSKEIEDEIITFLEKKSSWVVKIKGNWDFNTGIFARNSYEFKEIIDEFILKYNNYISKSEVSIVTQMYHYPKDFLISDKKFSKPQIMGFKSSKDYIIEEIDEIDYKILGYLLKNAKEKTIDIARELNLTEIIIRYRIKKLIEKGIILNFKAFLNVEKLDLKYFKVHLWFSDINKEINKEILNYIHTHKDIVYTTFLLGGADLEIEYQVKEINNFFDYLDEFNKKFGKYIRNYEFMQYTKEYKFSYLPEMDFKKIK